MGPFFPVNKFFLKQGHPSESSLISHARLFSVAVVQSLSLYISRRLCSLRKFVPVNFRTEEELVCHSYKLQGLEQG